MLGHSGREHVLAYLRQRYWLIHGNSMVRKVLADCWDCKRRQGKVGEQKMADLPEDRVNPGKPPFSCVGVDYFGPFFVREKRSLSKRYICYLPDGRSVLEKYFVEVSKTARGRRPRDVFETETKYFLSTDRPKRYITFLFFSA